MCDVCRSKTNWLQCVVCVPIINSVHFYLVEVSSFMWKMDMWNCSLSDSLWLSFSFSVWLPHLYLWLSANAPLSLSLSLCLPLSLPLFPSCLSHSPSLALSLSFSLPNSSFSLFLTLSLLSLLLLYLSPFLPLFLSLSVSPFPHFLHFINDVTESRLSLTFRELLEVEYEDSSLSFKLHALVSNANYNMKKAVLLLFINRKNFHSAFKRQATVITQYSRT